MQPPNTQRRTRAQIRTVFLAILGPWVLVEYLALSNIDPVPPPVQFDCSPGFGAAMSFVPVGPRISRLLACAQPVLGFPLRGVLRRAQTSLVQLTDSRWPTWGNIAFGFCFPFGVENRADFRLNFVYLTLLNSATQVLLFYLAALACPRPRRAT